MNEVAIAALVKACGQDVRAAALRALGELAPEESSVTALAKTLAESGRVAKPKVATKGKG
eukprot:3813224-Amphidinium_carterae.1